MSSNRWEVRPSVLIAAPSSVNALDPIIGEIKRHLGDACAGSGASFGPLGGVSLTATLVVEAPTIGRAIDDAVRLLEGACDAAGVPALRLHEVTALPGDIDERTW